MKGRLYHWCVGHQAWTLHKPTEYRLPNDAEAKSATPKTGKSPSYKEALQTIMTSIENDEKDIGDEE